MADKVSTAIHTVLAGLDDHIRDYISSVLADDPSQEAEELEGTVGPFLLSSEFAKDDEEVTALCKRLAEALSDANGGAKARPRKDLDDTPMLLSAPVSFKESRNSMDDKLLDLMWGKDKVRQTMNSTFDRAKTTNSKRVQRQQQKLLKDAYESDEEEEQVSLMVLPDYSSGSGEKDINVLNFCLRFAGQELLSSADLRLAYARRYGLVGKNGIGKTTLLKHIAAFEIEGFPRHHRVLHVKQEVRSSDKSVLEAVLQSDVERETLLEEEREIVVRQQRQKEGGGGGAGEGEDPSVMDVQADADRLNEIYARLAIIGSNTAEARAAVILNGLQFTPEMQAAPVSDLSGGWRMRVALASALFIEPDLLLLDEPTNHLDLEAVLWLQEYLKGYKHTVLLVSHDRAFLNEVVTDVVYFHDKTLTYYRGNYDTFEAVREEKIKNQRRLYEANVAKRAHMQDFIDKFRYNANRAALVQSRIKALEKMEVVEEPQEEGKFTFHLPVPEPLGRPVLNIDGVSFAYPLRTAAGEAGEEGEEATAPAPGQAVPRGKVLFKDVNLGIDLETKIGIVGPNGAGKSTLLNLMLDKLRPLEGNVFRHQNLRLASFTQHHNDQFDLKLSAAENFEAMFPKADTQELRSLLGRFGLSGDDAMRPMRFLSGGQKSRAAFALLAWRKPHIVILDEPTNHLDMNTIDALCEALKEFRGGLVVVSHDQHFISQVCSDIYVCGDGQVKRFPGSFQDYRNSFLSKLRKANATSGGR